MSETCSCREGVNLKAVVQRHGILDTLRAVREVVREAYPDKYQALAKVNDFTLQVFGE